MAETMTQGSPGPHTVHGMGRELAEPDWAPRLADGDGVHGFQSVLRRGNFCYEAHQVADGIDLYRRTGL